VTRRHSTGARVIDTAERAVLSREGVSHASSELAEQATASAATNKPPAPQDPVLAFSSADERFIDFLVKEALNEWRAKNF
jgi:hypothetical protein